MIYENYEMMKFSREGSILVATFDNPDQRNALAGKGERDVARFFYEVATDEETRVVILTGAGKAFSAGGDVNQMRDFIDNPQLFYGAITNAKRIVHNILDCPKPIIAKVNGPAAGLGATIALLCDVVFAASTAKFADPHVKVGFTAGDGGAVVWPYLLGGAAKHYLMTGEPILATDAERLGMIYKAVEPEKLDEVVSEYALKLANGPRRAIETSKLAANITLKHIATMTMDAGIAFEALSNYTQDHREAVSAFLEKRTPAFTGD